MSQTVPFLLELFHTDWLHNCEARIARTIFYLCPTPYTTLTLLLGLRSLFTSKVLAEVARSCCGWTPLEVQLLAQLGLTDEAKQVEMSDTRQERSGAP
eukprot:2811694-Amphidinium_carterae.2